MTMKYKYYSTQRPIDIGTYPKPPEAPEVELVFYDQRKPVENGTALAWGELIYDAPLTPEQVSGYELRPSRDNLDIRERMGVQSQAVGAWEKRNHIPEEKRLTSWEPNMQAFVPLPQTTIEQLARQFELALDFPTVTARPMKPRQNRPPPRTPRRRATGRRPHFFF